MPSLSKMFDTNVNHEREGVWVPYGDVSFKIARAGGANLAFQKAFTAAYKPIERSLELGLVSEEKLRELLADLYSKFVLKGWENVTDDLDQPLPFSPAAAKAQLLASPNLLFEIKRMAEKEALFRAQIVEDTSKN
jgi:hypothetical protein